MRTTTAPAAAPSAMPAATPADTPRPTPHASTRPPSTPTPRPTHTGQTPCATSGRNASLTIVNQTATWQFSPREVDISCGTRVTVTNRSNADHTWTGSSWDSGNLAAGTGSYSYTFRYPGTYSFVCSYHATMTGKVVVSGP